MHHEGGWELGRVGRCRRVVERRRNSEAALHLRDAARPGSQNMSLNNLALADSYRMSRCLRSGKGARCGTKALWKTEDVGLIQDLETAVRRLAMNLTLVLAHAGTTARLVWRG